MNTPDDIFAIGTPNNDPPVQASVEVRRRATVLYTEIVAFQYTLHGTKIIARDMPGPGKTPSSQRFRAMIRIPERDSWGHAGVEVWSDVGWILVNHVLVSSLPIAGAQSEPGEWEGKMRESLDALLVIGLDVVPC